MSTFKKTQIIDVQRSTRMLSEDNVYWNRMKSVAYRSDVGHIASIEFSPVSPHDFVTTCSSKVTLFGAADCEPKRVFSRFKSAVYGAAYRGDGSLLAVGAEDGRVRLFDAVRPANAPLRTFRAHGSATHCCRFAAGGRLVWSFGDDGAVKCWDVAAGDDSLAAATFDGHGDHARCGAAATLGDDLALSGSYDHTVRVWDRRAGCQVAEFNHGCPVESVLFFPNDRLIASAGGTSIRLWDLTVGGAALIQLSHHHKTITQLRLCSDNRRFFSAGLDSRIKIYDVSSYQVVHSLDYPAPLISAAISPDDSMLAVGMSTNNMLSVQRRTVERRPTTARSSAPTVAVESSAKSTTGETRVGRFQPTPMAKHDKYLRKFMYSTALTKVISSPYVRRRQPEVVVSVLRELQRRGGLRRALAGRDADTLVPLIRFVCDNLFVGPFAAVLLDVAHRLIDELNKDAGDVAPQTAVALRKLSQVVERQLQQQRDVARLMAEVELLIAASDRRPPTEESAVADEDGGGGGGGVQLFGAATVERYVRGVSPTRVVASLC